MKTRTKILIVAGALFCATACATEGRPIFVRPTWRHAGAEFRVDDDSCRRIYRMARQQGLTHDDAFAVRVRCMQDMGYTYRGTN